MPKQTSCPMCAHGKGTYYVVQRGAEGLQQRKCPLPHKEAAPATRKTKTKKATEEAAPLVPGGIPL